MRYPILPLLGITLSLTAIAGSVMAIPNFQPEREQKKLSGVDISSLWTSHPVAVDKSKQNFERLPALVVQRTATSSVGLDVFASRVIRPAMPIDQLPASASEGELAADIGMQASETNAEVAAWCSEQYRSYRASDNTYQPYNGARRQCQPPFMASTQDVSAELPQHASNISQGGLNEDDHARWCSARYRSYNPDNNTYRAFSGEIRACASPYI